MKERPILFSAPMVRAILDGRKTMTRRVVKNQPPSFCPYLTRCGGDFRWGWSDGSTVDFAWHPRGNGADMDSMWMPPPHGIPGDRLWVRETWKPHTQTSVHSQAIYAAEYSNEKLAKAIGNWHPSIFMPRWASRITLEITDVRVQRVQEISEEDAIAEGCNRLPDALSVPIPGSARTMFNGLWNSINGKKHPWESNPWVWTLTFKKVN